MVWPRLLFSLLFLVFAPLALADADLGVDIGVVGTPYIDRQVELIVEVTNRRFWGNGLSAIDINLDGPTDQVVATPRITRAFWDGPFGGGSLFRDVRSKPLPPVAAEIGAQSWAELFLAFVISHPAVTIAIPATSKVEHLRQNMRARVVGAAVREKIAKL